jgi:rod shape-determining protein MreD
MHRPLTLAVTLVLLWAILAELNHALSGLHFHVFGGALFVASAALHQPLRPGLAASLFGGLVCDANTPVAFGTHFVLFAAAHLFLHRVRDRVPRQDPVFAIVVVLLLNLALFLAFSLLLLPASPASFVVWPRLLADLIASQLVLAFATPWFFALQDRALALAEKLANRPTGRPA